MGLSEFYQQSVLDWWWLRAANSNNNNNFLNVNNNGNWNNNNANNTNGGLAPDFRFSGTSDGEFVLTNTLVLLLKQERIDFSLEIFS